MQLNVQHGENIAQGECTFRYERTNVESERGGTGLSHTLSHLGDSRNSDNVMCTESPGFSEHFQSGMREYWNRRRGTPGKSFSIIVGIGNDPETGERRQIRFKADRTNQDLLGHSVISTTLDIYSRLMLGLQDVAAVELGKAIESGRWQKCLQRSFRPNSVTRITCLSRPFLIAE